MNSELVVGRSSSRFLGTRWIKDADPIGSFPTVRLNILSEVRTQFNSCVAHFQSKI